MKRKYVVWSVACLLATVILFSSFAANADQTYTYTGTAGTISFSYSGTDGGVRIQASSDNYSFTFGLDAESFSGSFTGDGTGFVNSSAFTNGVGASLTTTPNITVGTSFAGSGSVTQSLNTTGSDSLVTVTVTIFGDNIDLKVSEPVVSTSTMWFAYIRDEKRNKVGGLLGNAGDETFNGTISFDIGLAYTNGWKSDKITFFTGGKSPILKIEPGKVVEFYILMNSLGGYTFLFPEERINGIPIYFHAFPPSPNSNQVGQFRYMIYNWYTGYRDPEPTVDYMQVHLTASPDTTKKKQDKQIAEIDFWLPMQPYFPPPR